MLKKSHQVFCAFLSLIFGPILGIPLHAEEASESDGVSEVSAVEEKKESPEDLIIRLMEASRNPEADFELVLNEAKEAGVEAQVLLEAQVSSALSQGDLLRLFSFIPVLESVKKDWVFEINRGFPTENEFDGFLAGLKTLKALRLDNDMAAFEQFAKETFWKSPNWAETFGIIAEITEIRNGEAMERYLANLKIEPSVTFSDLEGKAIRLGEMLEGNKAVLIDFWASWCGPCIAAFPGLKETAEKLSPQGIYVAAVNVDEADPVTKAKEVKESHGMNLPWLIDAAEDSLYRMLMVDSIPRAVLIGLDGGILFNGHPADPLLQVALSKLGIDE
mgnify:CR=1 FL=1